MNKLVLTFVVNGDLPMDRIHQIGKLITDKGNDAVKALQQEGKLDRMEMGNPFYAVVLSSGSNPRDALKNQKTTRRKAG